MAKWLKVMVTSDQKINVVRTGQKLGEPVQREFSTNPNKWASLCNDLIDVLQVGGIHQNGKYLNTISREGRNFPAPALHEVGMQRKGNCRRVPGSLRAERDASRSADVLPTLPLFTAVLGYRNMQRGLCWHLQSGYSLP